jgi:hypothetical protein
VRQLNILFNVEQLKNGTISVGMLTGLASYDSLISLFLTVPRDIISTAFHFCTKTNLLLTMGD